MELLPAIGLFYSGFEYKKSIRAEYYQTLSDIAEKIENLESSDILNTDFKMIAVKYLNLFERIAAFASKGFIDKSIARYFELNFRQARGLLEMDEFLEYKEILTYLVNWCDTERLDPSPPLLPYPNIRIVRDANSHAYFASNQKHINRYHAQVGDFVTWVNDDTNHHTITSGLGEKFDSSKSEVTALKKYGSKFSHEFQYQRSVSIFLHGTSDRGWRGSSWRGCKANPPQV